MRAVVVAAAAVRRVRRAKIALSFGRWVVTISVVIDAVRHSLVAGA